MINTIIHQFYFLLSGVFAFLLIRNLFKRETRKGIVYDIVYAYTIIPFILRLLHIK